MRFGVAYLCKRVITLRPIDPNATMKPTTIKRQGDVVELHSASEPVGLFREILRSSGGKAMLGAAEPLDGPFTDSPYAGVLKLVAKWKAQAAAKAKAEAQANSKPKAKAKARVAVWPPQFLLNSPRRPIQPA